MDRLTQELEHLKRARAAAIRQLRQEFAFEGLDVSAWGDEEVSRAFLGEAMRSSTRSDLFTRSYERLNGRL